MKKKKKKGRTGEKMVRWTRIRGRGKTEKRAGETANKAFESQVYIEVNVKTSNEHYVLITGT